MTLQLAFIHDVIDCYKHLLTTGLNWIASFAFKYRLARQIILPFFRHRKLRPISSDE
jgi:hypothetical protein